MGVGSWELGVGSWEFFAKWLFSLVDWWLFSLVVWWLFSLVVWRLLVASLRFVSVVSFRFVSFRSFRFVSFRFVSSTLQQYEMLTSVFWLLFSKSCSTNFDIHIYRHSNMTLYNICYFVVLNKTCSTLVGVKMY